jgi:hypothetical protein
MPIPGYPTPEVQRLTDSLVDATQRVRQGMQPPMPGLGPVVRLFAPLGEVLAWIVALDDTLEGADGTYRARRKIHADVRLIRGLRYARNQVIHGTVVVAYFHGGAVPGLMVLPAVPGQAPSYRWRASAELPAVTGAQIPLRNVYDSDIAKGELMPVLDRAVAYLRLEAGT